MNERSESINKRKVRSAAAALAVLLVLGSLIALFLNRLIGTDRILARGDTFLYFYPYWEAAARALGEGRVPLWNPNLFMGAPFLANSQVGFFYPLNWPVWLLFATPYAVTFSIVLHLLIAGCGIYLMARRCFKLTRPAAILAAVLFSLGGYLTSQVEHVNQIQGIAWLPWYFVLLCRWSPGAHRRREAAKLTAGLAAILSLQILSGHTQTVFISMVSVIIWLAVIYLGARGSQPDSSSSKHRVVSEAKQIWWFLSPVAGGVVLAIGITAVQLLPTLELSRLSLREGGLPPNEVLSFSLQPLLLGQSLLPSFDQVIFSEYVAFIPITALLLAALGALRMWRTSHGRPLLIIAVTGLVLALGRFNPLYYLLARLPGFNLFRAPARWTVLYALVVAILAAAGWQMLVELSRSKEPEGETSKNTRALVIGVLIVIALVAGAFLSTPLARLIPLAPETTIESPSSVTVIAWLLELALASILILLMVRRRAPKKVAWALLAGTIVVLFISTRVLPYNHPTTSRAYFEQRAPVSRLLAAAECCGSVTSGEIESGRVLGLSDIFFDLGDQQELDSIYVETLGQQERFDYIVASKQKEVLGPNLPLAYGLSSVDGFDGGVLPLKSYASLMELVLPAEQQTFDGRLREYLETIPEERWLDLFGVQYLITDKIGDQWRHDIFFDMKHPILISAALEPVRVGFVPEFEASDLYVLGEGIPGTASVVNDNGETWLLEPKMVERDLWRFPLPQPSLLAQIALNPCEDSAERPCDDGWLVNSLSLVDKRDGTFTSILPGDYRLVYSGDVKIYENLDPLPTATLIYDWQFENEAGATVPLMQSVEFDPARNAIVLGQGAASSAQGGGLVTVLRQEPERINLRTESDREALLVLTEAYYPGWHATIDGEPAELLQTNILFQGLFAPAGTHTIEVRFDPGSYQIGRVISTLSLIVWLALAIYAFWLPVLGRT